MWRGKGGRKKRDRVIKGESRREGLKNCEKGSVQRTVLSLCHRFSSHQLHLLFSAPHAVPSSADPKLYLRVALSSVSLKNVNSVFPPLISFIILLKPCSFITEDDAGPGSDVSFAAAKSTRSRRFLVGTTCLLSPPAGHKWYFIN